nr:MAG TPA: hypothetical protein [Caudoviricetes sp.]
MKMMKLSCRRLFKPLILLFVIQLMLQAIIMLKLLIILMVVNLNPLTVYYSKLRKSN